MASIRKDKKLIGKLKVGNSILSHPRSIEKETIRFFKDLYATRGHICVEHSGIGFPRLTEEQRELLELLPSREEIKQAV